MSKKIYEETSVQNIANAIRQKNGDESAKYKIGDMASAILALPSGGELISVYGTENGTYYPNNSILGEWQFNDSLNASEEFYCDLIFSSNNKTYSKIAWNHSTYGMWSLFYDNDVVYLGNNWASNSNYKTIEINGGDLNNSDLLSFLTANAQNIRTVSANGFSAFTIASSILSRVTKVYHGTITPSSNISGTAGIKINHYLGEIPNVVFYRAKDNIPTQTYSMLAGIYIKDFDFIGSNYCAAWKTANSGGTTNSGSPVPSTSVVTDLTKSSLKIKGDSESRYFRAGTTYEIFAMCINFDQPIVFNITYNLNGITSDASNPSTIKPGASATLTFNAQDGYKVPESLSEIAIENATGSYARMSDSVGILALSQVTGDVTITINGIPV